MITPQELEQIRTAYHHGLPVSPACEAHLAGVIQDTLSHPGNLVRAQMIYRFLVGFGQNSQTALDIATAVEYFHTASLLLDDLPCMDDALERRGQTCPHVTHGEAAAILGALAFINRAYALIWRGLDTLPRARRQRAAALIESCLGVLGVLDGQSRDLHFGSGPQTAEAVAEIAAKKTSALIRLTLVLPGIMVGLNQASLNLLEELSEQWGLAYQVLDDLKDLYDTDSAKTAGRDASQGRPNMALCIGVSGACQKVEQILGLCDRKLRTLLRRNVGCHFLSHLQTKLRGEQTRLLRLAQAA